MNLFIGNLNPETTASKLRPLFAEFGEVVSAKVIIDNATGMSRGFGFVEYVDRNHAMDAIDNLDATFFEGNIISVKEAKQSNTKGAPAGRGGFGNRSGGGGFGNRNTGGGGGFGGNKPMRPRVPRPGGGGYNSNNNSSGGGGGYNSNNNSGGYNNNAY